jgi:hypothetical protein
MPDWKYSAMACLPLPSRCILIPFFAAFMAEDLNTPFAQPAIVCYCLVSLLHNTGWLALHQSIATADPPLRTDPVARELGKRAYRGARYGFVIYAALALLAWWLPYVALVLTVLTWSYWLYLSISVKVAEPTASFGPWVHNLGATRLPRGRVPWWAKRNAETVRGGRA